MILSDFILPSRVNQQWDYSGSDSLELCHNPRHFKGYPHNVSYNYNDRGFRDHGWPDSVDQLQQAVWCIGDSFTAGLGSPLEHTWPHILQESLKIRTINISMDGASNDWIFRKVVNLINTIQPKVIVIHWSYVERAELSIAEAFNRRWKKFYNDICDQQWPAPPDANDFNSLPLYIQEECLLQHKVSQLSPISDEHRILEISSNTIKEDIQKTLDYIHELDHFFTTQVIHTFIPNFLPKKYIRNFNSALPNTSVIPMFPQLDYARDFHHYDITTSTYLVNEILKIIEV